MASKDGRADSLLDETLGQPFIAQSLKERSVDSAKPFGSTWAVGGVAPVRSKSRC